jgi:hypothetical protein
MFGKKIKKLKEKLRDTRNDMAMLDTRVNVLERELKQLTCEHPLKDRMVNNGSWGGTKREYCNKCNKILKTFNTKNEVECRSVEIDEERIKEGQKLLAEKLKEVKINQKELKCKKCPKTTVTIRNKRLH